MPQYICSFAQIFYGAASSAGGADASLPQTMQQVNKLVGMGLGMGLMLLGRVLYKPLLFFLPAMIIGCAMIQPLAPSFNQYGISQAHTSAIGSVVGLLLALLQRHVMVWFLGVLIGTLTFIAALVWTPWLSHLPAECVVLVGGLFALVGSSVIWHMEQTRLWKVSACALVGSLLFTDAIGVGQVHGPLQVWVCAALVLMASWQQLRWGRTLTCRIPSHRKEVGGKKAERVEIEREVKGGKCDLGTVDASATGQTQPRRRTFVALYCVMIASLRLLCLSAFSFFKGLRTACTAVWKGSRPGKKEKVE